MPSPRLAAGLRRATPRPPSLPRLPFTRLVVALTATALLATTPPPSASAHHAGAAPGPVHAGSTYGWGHRNATKYREEFIGHLPSRWRKHGRGQVRIQHGMLTLNTTRHGSLSALRGGHAARVGRWETRLRSRRYGHGHANYRVMTELVPRRGYHCGAQNVAIEDYTAGTRKVRLTSRSLAQHQFRAVERANTFGQRWHTYAVEVRKHRIAWFVDAHVVRVEKRPDALSGVPLRVRFTMKARPGKRMNKSRMQMDWLRHWSLASKNQKPVRAQRTQAGRFDGAC